MATFDELLDRISDGLAEGNAPDPVTAADFTDLFLAATNPESEWKCPMCLGSGEDPGDPELTCANCGGSGWFV